MHLMWHIYIYNESESAPNTWTFNKKEANGWTRATAILFFTNFVMAIGIFKSFTYTVKSVYCYKWTVILQVEQYKL